MPTDLRDVRAALGVALEAARHEVERGARELAGGAALADILIAVSMTILVRAPCAPLAFLIA